VTGSSTPHGGHVSLPPLFRRARTVTSTRFAYRGPIETITFIYCMIDTRRRHLLSRGGGNSKPRFYHMPDRPRSVDHLLPAILCADASRETRAQRQGPAPGSDRRPGTREPSLAQGGTRMKPSRSIRAYGRLVWLLREELSIPRDSPLIGLIASFDAQRTTRCSMRGAQIAPCASYGALPARGKAIESGSRQIVQWMTDAECRASLTF
jgi:hypothetical protein